MIRRLHKAIRRVLLALDLVKPKPRSRALIAIEKIVRDEMPRLSSDILHSPRDYKIEHLYGRKGI